MVHDETTNDGSETPIRIDQPQDSDDRTDIPAGSEHPTSANEGGSNRRTYLQLLGAGIIGSSVLSRNDVTRVENGGPPEQSNRVLAVEDSFGNPSLDRDTWEVGWGWGSRTRTSPTRIVPENVNLRDEKLFLEASHDNGDILAGAVNTKGKMTVGPGSYFEARIKFPDREGFLPAFWAKPDDGTWPPEIDVVELFQEGNDRADTHRSHHTLHYAASTQPGDRSTHESRAKTYVPGDDLTENFHVYGVDWRSDRIVHYVDGEKTMVTTDSTIVEAMAKAAPFYLLCSLEIDHVGTADTSETWDESVVIDWVRVWE